MSRPGGLGAPYKIVLYNPRAVFYTMPLALLAVGSALDPRRYRVRIIDGRLERDPVRAVLEETEDALCLGITVLTGAPIRDALHVSRAVRARRPDLPIVWGGWHPSLFPAETLDEPAVDITVQGQGEVTFAEVVERLGYGAGIDALEGVAGCAFRAQERPPCPQPHGARGCPVPSTGPRTWCSPGHGPQPGDEGQGAGRAPLLGTAALAGGGPERRADAHGAAHGAESADGTAHEVEAMGGKARAARGLPVVGAGARASGGVETGAHFGTAAHAAEMPSAPARSGVRLNGPRPLTPVNELPACDYSLIPVEEYFARKRWRQLDYITSTGCHFRCAFCADPFVFKRKWVALDPGRVGAEVAALWRRHRFHDLNFQDETFFTFRDRVAAIAQEFLRRGLRFTWAATMRADQGYRLPEETWRLCVRSGLRRVMIGVESGSQEMLDWMQKDITIEQVLDAAEKCVRHGVHAIFPFIVGFPGEPDASVRATLELAARLRRMSPGFETPIFYYKPYPGSPITDRVVAAGYRLPASLAEWASFDFIGSSGPWVDEEKHRLVERFKFYNRFAGGPARPWKWPLRAVARWRVERHRYGFPVEKAVVDALWPQPELS